MKPLKILGMAGGLVAAAVVGGALIGAVSAHPSSPAAGSGGATVATSTDPGAYCQAFLDAFAANLGIDVADLAPAAKDAAKTAIDKAVENGDLTQALADQLKQRIDAADGNGCGWFGAHLGMALRNVVRADIGHDLVSAAADVLKMDPAELRSAIAGGKSLKQIAADQGVAYTSVTSAIHDAAKADLDKIVAAGKMTAEREQAILDRLDQALKDGKLFNGSGPLGGQRLMGPGRGFGMRPFAPAASASPGASAS